MKRNLIFLFLLVSCMSSSFSQSIQDEYFRVQAEFENGNIHSSLRLSDSLLHVYPDNFYFIGLKAELNYKFNAYATAIETYYLLMPYDSALALLQMARCSALLDKDAEAISYISRYLNLPQAFDFAEVRSDTCFRSLSRTEEWRNFWINFEPNRDKVKLSELQYMIDQKLYHEILIDDIVFSNDIYNYYLQLMKIEAFCALGDYKEALRKITPLIKNRSAINLFEQRAEIYSGLKQYVQAIDDYTSCINLNPYNAKYYLNRAIALNNARRYKEAASDFRYYLNFFDYDEDVWYKCGIVLMNNSEYSEAIEVFTRLIDMNSVNEEYHVLRGDAYVGLLRRSEAVSDYLMALDINPYNGDSYFKLGWCCYAMKDTEKACYYWGKAMHFKQPDAEITLQRYCK